MKPISAAVRPALLALALLAACGEEQSPPPPPAAAVQAADPGAPPSPAAATESVRLGYGRGSPDAPITVLEFSDFGCPYCGRFALETLPALEREFLESGQVQWRYVPFVMGNFPNGEQAALAAECAGEQDRFWPMHDLLYQQQREWKGSDEPGLLMQRYARAVGLDAATFEACFAAAAPAQRIEEANRLAQQLGVRATPTFFINGYRVEGALPVDQFRMMLQWAGAGPE